jgi:uncharacterized membrane protein (DUF4010 family)
MFDSVEWPFDQALARMALALAIGLFVGLERERRNKTSGLRTFGLVALLGCLGGMLGQNYALLSLVLLGILIVFMNLQTLQSDQDTELTTSSALLVIGFTGVLCGIGQTFTPVGVAVATAAMLSWKEPLRGFSIKLSETELRSAILLAILAFIIYPALPEEAIDPWGVVSPQATFITVIIIAAISCVNYILWKLYGEKGIVLTGFLAGLVNSMAAVSELASRVQESKGQLLSIGYRGIMLAVGAMILRNGLIMGVLAPQAITNALIAHIAMIICCAVIFFLERQPLTSDSDTPLLHIKSPFSLSSALRFGAIFLILQIISFVAQEQLGNVGLYSSTIIGSIVSSASTVAATATLAAQGSVPPENAGISTVLASLTSTIVTIPLVMRAKNAALTKRISWAVSAIVATGLIGSGIQMFFLA